MKKILLLITTALFAISATTTAATDNIEGTYKGDLDITFTKPTYSPTSMDQDIVVSKVGDTYSFSINDFMFMGENVGNIVFDGVIATPTGTGYDFSREGNVSTMVTLYDEGAPVPIPVNIALTAGGYTTASSTITLTLSIEDALGGLMAIVSVDFTGKLFTASLIKGKAESLSVFPTVVEGDMGITVGGSNSESYAVYAQSGALVKSGKLNAGTFNLSGLPQGVYILSIEGKTAKLVKK